MAELGRGPPSAERAGRRRGWRGGWVAGGNLRTHTSGTLLFRKQLAVCNLVHYSRNMHRLLDSQETDMCWPHGPQASQIYSASAGTWHGMANGTSNDEAATGMGRQNIAQDREHSRRLIDPIEVLYRTGWWTR